MPVQWRSIPSGAVFVWPVRGWSSSVVPGTWLISRVVSPSVVISCPCGVYWCVVRGVLLLLLMLNSSLFDVFFVLCLWLWLLSYRLPSFHWCLVCLWSCDVDGESCLWLVLVSFGVSSLCLCLCWLWVCKGVHCFLIWWAGVIPVFAGLWVLWGSLWFDADFSDWGVLQWCFFILRCRGLICRDGDISWSCFVDDLAVVPSFAPAPEVVSTDLDCSFWVCIGVCCCWLLFSVMFFRFDCYGMEYSM